MEGVPMNALGRNIVLGVSVLGVAVAYAALGLGSVVMNGTSSLPHNGYFMLRIANVHPKGSYVAFEAPSIVADEFKSLSFVKRVVGIEGDHIAVDGDEVCVDGQCRVLLDALTVKGFAPLEAGVVPQGRVAVFGDAPNSLDSRYAAVGLIAEEHIQAVGWPIPVPNWKVVRAWLDQ
jgi:conjugal transfer pilin signal peptidase TrbI